MVPTKLEVLKCPKKFNKLFILTLNCLKKSNLISSSYTKYRAIAFNIKKIRMKQILLAVPWGRSTNQK